MTNINSALTITVLGMGLVFGMILILWMLMALLVHIGSIKTLSGKSVSQPDTISEIRQKQQAAAVAVAIALNRKRSSEPHEFPMPPTAIVSAWQAVMRSDMLTKRGRRK